MFLLQQWLLERATILGYSYIACLVTVQIPVSADIGYYLHSATTKFRDALNGIPVISCRCFHSLFTAVRLTECVIAKQNRQVTSCNSVGGANSHQRWWRKLYWNPLKAFCAWSYETSRRLRNMSLCFSTVMRTRNCRWWGK